MEKRINPNSCLSCDEKLILEVNIKSYNLINGDYICITCKNLKIKSSDSYKRKRTTDIKKIHNRSELDKKIIIKLGKVIAHSKTRNIEFTLNKQEAFKIIKENCNYCDKSNSVSNLNGLDRVNSDLGYIPGNVVACCKTCNWGKNSLTVQEFLDHCKKVVSFQALGRI